MSNNEVLLNLKSLLENLKEFIEKRYEVFINTLASNSSMWKRCLKEYNEELLEYINKISHHKGRVKYSNPYMSNLLYLFMGGLMCSYQFINTKLKETLIFNEDIKTYFESFICPIAFLESHILSTYK